jgi:hypothetical protein
VSLLVGVQLVVAVIVEEGVNVGVRVIVVVDDGDDERDAVGEDEMVEVDEVVEERVIVDDAVAERVIDDVSDNASGVTM